MGYDDQLQKPSHILYQRKEKSFKRPSALSTVWESEKQETKRRNVKKTMSLRKIHIRIKDAYPRLLFRGFPDNELSMELKQYTMGVCPQGFCQLYEGGNKVEYSYNSSRVELESCWIRRSEP